MSKYDRIIKGVKVDVYDIIAAYNVTDGALQHLLKKALCAGERGHKDRGQDLQDIVDSALRAQAIHQEKEASLYNHHPIINLMHRLDQDSKITHPSGGWKIDAVTSLTNTGYITTGKSSDPAATASVTIKNDGNVADQALADAVADEIAKSTGNEKRKRGDKIRELKLRLMAYEPRDLRYEAIRALDRLANAVDGQVPDGANIKDLAPGEVRLPALEQYFDTALDILKAEIDVTKHVDEVIKRSCKPGGMIYCAIRGIKN